MKIKWTGLLAALTLGWVNAAELPPPVIGGYYEVGGDYDSYPCDRVHPDYNILYNAFLQAGAAGELLLDQEHLPNPELVRHGHQRNLPVLVSLGGGTPFVEVTATPEKCAAYVDKVIKHVQKYDYDGIDVDWEHPREPEQGARWTELIRSLRSELDKLGKRNGRKMYLTTALPPGDWAWQHNDFAVMRDCLDYINVMCYDSGWNSSTYHAPMHANPADPGQVNFVEQLEFLEKKVGYPRSKIIVGLPFYGNYFEADQPFVPVDPQHWRQVTYADALKLSEGYKRSYDHNSGGVWAWAPDQKKLVIYDSPQSIYDKTQYYLNQGYGGVFCWAVNRDVLPDGSQPLTGAMMQSANDFSAAQAVKSKKITAGD